jgi:dipeptidyl aminopeptidase/acylaminoacyl peptidase
MFLAAAALAATLTVEDYATMPALSSPHFSPDGKRIAYVLTRADLARSVYDADLWVIDADGRNDIQLTHSTANDTHPRWAPDGLRLAFLSDRDGSAAIWLIETRGGEPWKLTSGAGAILDFAWSPDGKSIAFIETDPVTAEDERRVKEREDWHVEGAAERQSHLHVIDVASREVRRLTRSTRFSVNGLSWSPDGKTIVIERLPALSLDALYRTDLYTIESRSSCDDNSCPAMSPLVVRPGVDRAPQFSPDGRSVAFLSSGGVLDWLRESELWVVDLATRKAHVVSRDYHRAPENVSWLDAKTLIFDGPMNTTSQLFRVDADGSGFRSIAGENAMIADSDVDRAGRATYVYQTLTAPPEIFVDGRQLTHHNDAMRAKRRAETRLIRWKNPKDGLEIEGLLTLPIGYEAGKRVPLLTFVHGGPASRFDQAFLGYLASLYAPDALAAQGFAVLRPNPRGTGGYGQAFRQGNRNDWGGMDWIDINAGIDKLIADGIADSSRLGIMGWSYGGFMTSWAEGHSDRFKAISIGAPVTDLVSFHGTADIRDFIPHYFPSPATAPQQPEATSTDAPTLDAMRHVTLNLELLRAHSPIWHLQPSKAHVLIEHGEMDERVPLSQGTMLYRFLQELGVDVQMVTYPRSHHVPSEPKQRIDVARRNVEFFSRWLLPQK